MSLSSCLIDSSMYLFMWQQITFVYRLFKFVLCYFVLSVFIHVCKSGVFGGFGRIIEDCVLLCLEGVVKSPLSELRWFFVMCGKLEKFRTRWHNVRLAVFYCAPHGLNLIYFLTEIITIKINWFFFITFYFIFLIYAFT